MALIRWPVIRVIALLTCAVLLNGCGPSADERGTTNAGGNAPDNAKAGEIISADLSHLSGAVKIDGSSSLFPVTEAAAEEFQNATKHKVKVTVGETGTGSGFRRFLRDEIDICDASRPITKEELEGAKQAGIEFIELPVCFDALTIAVHPSNKLESISTADLKKMWSPEAEGAVKRWKQVNPDWPDEELVLFGAGASSGTFEYFTGAVTGKARSSRGDYTASEDDNVLVQGIAGNRNALGYIPFAYFEPNKGKLKALAIDWDKDTEGPVAPSMENVERGKYNPFSRPLFLYVNRKGAGRPEVKAFIEFYLQNARTFASEQSYLPLPDAAYQMVSERFAKLETGTGFKGEPEFGLRVEEILQRPPQN
ncbi:MAG TPA: PstS family phosphate ABC transporter substrate-binding protein [Planctomycetaceae bacterium]|nr:PstS family phosphate ABC transporter substrate-binding protein [Planctomycetaceae bacterium]